MRLLTLSWEYPPDISGGLGRHVAELVPALVEQGIAVDVVTPTAEFVGMHPLTEAEDALQVSTTDEAGVSVHRVYVPHNQDSPDIYSRVVEVNQKLQTYVEHLAREHQWDLIHTHDWLTGFATLALRASLSLPVVATIHATERGRSRGHIYNNLQRSIDHAEQELIHAADKVIVCSQHMFQELQSFFGTTPERMDIVPNGVDIAGLSVDLNVNPIKFRAQYAMPHEKIVFTISRLVYEKGVHRLIEATPRILEECPDTRVVVAGRGPEAQNLRHQAQHLGITDRVKFIGFIPDETRNMLFKVADCAVFPSIYEPFGIVALEAMALGCPVVASDVGGLSEVVTHRETGITIYPDDAESVAWGVVRALTRPEWATEHAAKARSWVEENFNWNRIARLTKVVYDRMLITPVTK